MSPEEKGIALSAAEFMEHWMEELGAEQEDCIDAAKQIYEHLTGEELDVELLGWDEEDLEEEDEEEEDEDGVERVRYRGIYY